METRTIKPALPDAPPVELPPLPTEFPPLPDIKLPVIQEVLCCGRAGLDVLLMPAEAPITCCPRAKLRAEHTRHLNMMSPDWGHNSHAS